MPHQLTSCMPRTKKKRTLLSALPVTDESSRNLFLWCLKHLPAWPPPTTTTWKFSVDEKALKVPNEGGRTLRPFLTTDNILELKTVFLNKKRSAAAFRCWQISGLLCFFCIARSSLSSFHQPWPCSRPCDSTSPASCTSASAYPAIYLIYYLGWPGHLTEKGPKQIQKWPNRVLLQKVLTLGLFWFRVLPKSPIGGKSPNLVTRPAANEKIFSK